MALKKIQRTKQVKLPLPHSPCLLFESTAGEGVGSRGIEIEELTFIPVIGRATVWKVANETIIPLTC